MKKLYKLNLIDRKNEILKKIDLDIENKEIFEKNINLDLEIANNMVENVFMTYSLPMGLATNFIINNKEYNIPFVTEEPSVIAAACNGAKITSKNGGYISKVLSNNMIGEVLFDIEEYDKLKKFIFENMDKLYEIAKLSHPSIYNRGGGLKKIRLKKINKFVIIYLYIDTKEAMGANIVNTISESIKEYIEKELKISSLVAILSNYALEQMVYSKCIIPISNLDEDINKSKKIAYNIEKISKLSNVDIYRATTNNKGIMNGITAVALALSQDIRAIEAGVHSYASRKYYKSLTRWKYDKKKNILIGSIKLPIQVGSKGGSININPATRIAMNILENPNKEDIMNLLASVGLNQNFSALKALVTTGIQKGHMKLHYKNMALSVGAMENEIELILEELSKEKIINTEKIKEIIKRLRKK